MIYKMQGSTKCRPRVWCSWFCILSPFVLRLRKREELGLSGYRAYSGKKGKWITAPARTPLDYPPGRPHPNYGPRPQHCGWPDCQFWYILSSQFAHHLAWWFDFCRHGHVSCPCFPLSILKQRVLLASAPPTQSASHFPLSFIFNSSSGKNYLQHKDRS